MSKLSREYKTMTSFIVVAMLSSGGIAFADNYYFRSKPSVASPRSPTKATLSVPVERVRSGAVIDGGIDTSISNPKWSITQTPATPTLELTASDNSVSGTAPTVLQATKFTISAQAASGMNTATSNPAEITVYPQLTMTGGPASKVTLNAGQPFPAHAEFVPVGMIGNGTFELMSGASAADISATCPGLAFSNTTGRISGVLTTNCSQTYAVKVTDSFDGATSVSSQFSIAAPLAFAGTPKLAYPGTDYSFELNTLVTGGKAPYTFAIVTGNLPAGIAMSSAGTLSGTVAASAVASTPKIEVTDADGQKKTSDLAFAIGVSNAIALGANSDGQLGDGTNAGKGVPARVSGGKVYTKLSGGATHSCGIVDDGTVQCWGAGGNGRLGLGDMVSRTVPTTVEGLTNTTSISAGMNHTCAVSNGAVRCWGNNDYQKLGVNGGDRSTPVTVVSSGATAVSAGTYNTCAIVSGRINCWGYDGERNNAGNNYTGATDISVGMGHACAVINGGALCWGSGSSGQLGLGYNASGGPYNVSGLGSGVTAIAAGGMHTCAIQNGAAKCWGYGYGGTLGDGGGSNQPAPVQVIGMESGVTAITAGEYFSCGIKNGAIKCWGSIGYSSLNAPVADGPAAFTFIEAGNGHFLAK